MSMAVNDIPITIASVLLVLHGFGKVDSKYSTYVHPYYSATSNTN